MVHRTVAFDTEEELLWRVRISDGDIDTIAADTELRLDPVPRALKFACYCFLEWALG
jgi:hypothetical protein